MSTPQLLLREATITIPKQNTFNNQILDKVRDQLIERFHQDFPLTPYVTEYEDTIRWSMRDVKGEVDPQLFRVSAWDIGVVVDNSNKTRDMLRGIATSFAAKADTDGLFLKFPNGEVEFILSEKEILRLAAVQEEAEDEDRREQERLDAEVQAEEAEILLAGGAVNSFEELTFDSNGAVFASKEQVQAAEALPDRQETISLLGDSEVIVGPRVTFPPATESDLQPSREAGHGSNLNPVPELKGELPGVPTKVSIHDVKRDANGE